MTWISIKDRLPDKDYVALMTDGQHVTLADWTRRDGWMLDREDKALGISSDVFTHRMLLPPSRAEEPRES